MYNPEKEKVVVFIIIAVHSWGLLVQRVLAFVRAATPNKLQIFFDDDIMEILTLLPCRRHPVLHARNMRGSSYKAANSNIDLGGGIVKGGGDEGSGGER